MKLETHQNIGPVYRRRQLDIIGMTCPGEAAGLERRLRHHRGVADVTVNPLTERAYIVYDPAVLDVPGLITLIEVGGYGVA